MTHLNPTFAELGVRDEIVRALEEDGKVHPFAIQELTMPLALAGERLVAQPRRQAQQRGTASALRRDR